MYYCVNNLDNILEYYVKESYAMTVETQEVQRMKRKITEYLVEWKNSPYRKPLILQGARQTGKTFSILAFGREQYANVAYFNFETNPSLRNTFDESIEPSYLIPLLSRICGQTIIKERTLIVFDEVQLCERALTSLKYFCESAPEYHVVAVGSLLGVAVNRETFSFPVGKVDIKTLYPMDMEEFLLAFGEQGLVTQIRSCFEKDTPMPAALHDAALNYYRQYLLVGGMPECVEKYISTKDFILLRHAQALILESYLNDMSKYNKENEIKKTRLAYDNITVQLSKKNTRFQYKLIKSGARAAEFENAIEWLALSGIVTRIHRVEHPTKPLENYRDIDAFKIYMSDVGLLCAKKDIVVEDILYQSRDLADFKGGMAENYVCGQLIANGYPCYYWMSGRGAEVDFVIQREGKVIPIEVKSAENTKAKSLAVYISSYKPAYSVKLSTKNFGFEDSKKTVPLYAAFCL
jgi:predicted AAA+ superfamily ATPase